MNPGVALSRQEHHYCPASWAVAHGTAFFTIDEPAVRFRKNEAICFSPGLIHQLRDSANIPFFLNEIQSDSQLSEVDIVSLEYVHES